jgi:hypothetical protein
MIKTTVLGTLVVISTSSISADIPDFIKKERNECLKYIPTDILYIQNMTPGETWEEKLVTMSSRYDMCAGYFYGSVNESLFNEIAIGLAQLSVHLNDETYSQINVMSIENIKINILVTLDKLAM